MTIKYLSERTIEFIVICLTIIIDLFIISSVEKKGIELDTKKISYCQDVYTHEDMVLESCK